MNKKGFELAVRTIVIIVLAVLTLIAILVIWNQQTRFFSDFLKQIGGETNIDTLVLSCNSLKTQEAIYDYCCVNRKIVLEKKEELELTCDELREKEFTAGRIEKLNCENSGCSNEKNET